MVKTVTKGQLGRDDINFGSGTFSRATSTGGTQNINRFPVDSTGIASGHLIPITTKNDLGSTSLLWDAFLDTATAGVLNNVRVIDGNKYAQTIAGIQAAVNDAGPGELIFVPPLPGARYSGSVALNIDASTKPGLRLIGGGWANSTAVFVGTELLFTGATNGINVTGSANTGPHIEGFCINGNNTGSLSAIRLAGSPSALIYVRIKNCLIRPLTGSNIWTTGIEFASAQNVSVEDVLIEGSTFGGIANFITLDDGSRGNEFRNVWGKGKATSGTATAIKVAGSAGFSWFGGDLQGGFTDAVFKLVGNGGANSIAIFGPRIEVTSGGGLGYDIDNTNGDVTLHAPRGGAVRVGNSATTRSVSIFGGATGNITVGSFAVDTLIWPNEVNNTVTDNGTRTFIGPLRRTGQSANDPLKIGTGIVKATASLPAAGASNDGLLILEDAGAGDRNLIIYAGGQRFRIDGGAAF